MRTILLIDDDPMVRHVIAKVLGKGGYKVHVATNGVEGLHTFRAVQPDLVITDMVMPLKGGLDTIELLRTWSPEIKIVAISGGNRSGNKDYSDEATERGAAAFIAKPFEPAELLAKIADCLGG
jgi:CheY-like chemotaxis protein